MWRICNNSPLDDESQNIIHLHTWLSMHSRVFSSLDNINRCKIILQGNQKKKKKKKTKKKKKKTNKKLTLIWYISELE